MMGGLCLGALRLQRGQSFWAAEGTGDGGLAEEEKRRRKTKKERAGGEKKGKRPVEEERVFQEENGGSFSLRGRAREGEGETELL